LYQRHPWIAKMLYILVWMMLLFLKVGLTLYRASISDDSLIEQLVDGALLFAVEIISIGATIFFTGRQSLGIP